MNTRKRLSRLERLVTLVIFIAMAVGIEIGYLAPSVTRFIAGLQVGTTSIPITVGSIIAPVIARS
jgi:ACR3 family arsenite transporter